MASPSTQIDWLRCALPEQPTPDPRHHHPFFQRQLDAAMAHALENPKMASPRLSTWFRKNRSLGSKDRKRVQNAVFGLIRHEHILKRADMWRQKPWSHCWIELSEGQRFEHLPQRSPKEDFACALSLPTWIAEEWRQKHSPSQCCRLAQAINQQAPIYIRSLKMKATALKALLHKEKLHAECVPQSPWALKLAKRINIQQSPAFRKGLFEVQDLSSQLLCDHIAQRLPSKSTILDMCAGAGGKSLTLSALGMNMYATDIRPSALDELRKRAQRTKHRITLGHPKKIDAVLIDAPCSGLGRIRRDPAIRWRYAIPQDINIAQQRNLLSQAATLLKEQGILIYATCSLLNMENNHSLPLWNRQGEQWIWPEHGDGFFWQVLHPPSTSRLA